MAANSKAATCFPKFIDLLKVEAVKPAIAPGNAFVLTEWFSILLAQFGSKPDLWKKWGLDIVKADASALEICMGSEGRPSVKHSALVVTRRGLRKVLKSAPKLPPRHAWGACVDDLEFYEALSHRRGHGHYEWSRGYTERVLKALRNVFMAHGGSVGQAVRQYVLWEIYDAVRAPRAPVTFHNQDT